MTRRRPYTTASSGTLARWLASEPPSARVAVRDAEAALLVLLPLLTADGAPLDHERAAVVALDARRTVIDAAVLTTGSHRQTLMDPAHILRWALTRERPCVCLIIAHNHPSGDPAPSKEDRAVTYAMRNAAHTIGLELLDHLVIGAAGTYRSAMHD